MNLEEIGAEWQPPAGLGFSSVRPVRLTSAGIALLVMAVLLLAGSLALGAVLWSQSQRDELHRRLLGDQGVTTQATIERLWRSGDKESTPRMRYRFAVDGREYTGSTKVPRTIWRTLEQGMSLDVRYLPIDPSVSHPVQWRPRVTPWFLAVLIPVFFAGFAVLMTYPLRRQWRLLSEGRPAPGVVTSVRRTDKSIRVKYEFRLLNGSKQSGRANASGKALPGIGSVVCVVYDRYDPSRSALYPMALVRVDAGR
jgi:Protein of unknown function (DUF3592)